MSVAARRSQLLVPLGWLGVIMMMLVTWQVSSGMTFAIPDLKSTAQALVDNLGDPAYLADLRVTMWRIFLGFAIGVTLGAGIGIVLGYSPRLRAALEPLIVAANSVPKIILYPLLLPIVGLGTMSQVVMGVIHALFPMLIMITGAVAHLSPMYRKLSRSLNASQWQRLTRITIPAVRRPLLTGMRLGISLATIGVILAEFFTTKDGVGRLMKQAYQFGLYADLMSTVVLILAMTFTLSLALWLVERRLPE